LHGLNIMKKQLSLDEIDTLLIKHILLILVDDRYIHCTTCKLMTITGDKSSLIHSDYEHHIESYHKNHFFGHYIILNGISSDNQYYMYVDADTNEQRCIVKRHILELAFNAEGTDHDIIAVQLPETMR